MRILNLQYRGIDRTTDVLSFPQLSADEQQAARAEAKASSSQCSRASELPLGDIVINLPKAKRQANEYGLTLSGELRRLIVHGLLHLVGYDHEKGRYQKRIMELREKKLLRGL